MAIEGPVYKDDHSSDGLSKLVPPFWGKPRIAALIQIALDKVQELEDAALDVYNVRTIDGADELNLKRLGKIVGQKRFDLGVEDFRRAIQARSRANQSHGHFQDIADVFLLIANDPDRAFQIFGLDPATVILIDEEIQDYGDLVARDLLEDTRQGGNCLWLLVSDIGIGDALTYATVGAGNTWPASTVNGLIVFAQYGNDDTGGMFRVIKI